MMDAFSQAEAAISIGEGAGVERIETQPQEKAGASVIVILLMVVIALGLIASCYRSYKKAVLERAQQKALELKTAKIMEKTRDQLYREEQVENFGEDGLSALSGGAGRKAWKKPQILFYREEQVENFGEDERSDLSGGAGIKCWPKVLFSIGRHRFHLVEKIWDLLGGGVGAMYKLQTILFTNENFTLGGTPTSGENT